MASKDIDMASLENLFQGSNHAALYSKFRPSPPQELINSIMNYLLKKINIPLKSAVDIGCGSGQSTVVLAPYFEKVTGCDVSGSQIDCARRERSAQNIEYRLSDCEKLPFPDSSVQLVTSSQAVHWFDTSKLFSEVKRILVPCGAIAVYGYWIPLPNTGNIEKDEKLENLIVNELYRKQLGKYWHRENFILDNQYRDINFPFKDVQRLNVIKRSECSLADYMGYLSTWSAYQKLLKEDEGKAVKLLKDIENQLLDILSCTQSLEEVVFSLHTDFFMLMGRC